MATAKGFTVATVVYLIISLVYSLAVYDDMLASYAKYLTSGLGDYPRYEFISNVLSLIFIILIILTIIFWIVAFVNRTRTKK